MPAGRKSGKGSKTTSKSTRKSFGGGKTAHSGAPGTSSTALLLREEESCPTPQLLPASQPDNEIEGMNDGKLSELSAEEPDSSECECKDVLYYY